MSTAQSKRELYSLEAWRELKMETVFELSEKMVRWRRGGEQDTAHLSETQRARASVKNIVAVAGEEGMSRKNPSSRVGT
jgi:hypothetical protein